MAPWAAAGVLGIFAVAQAIAIAPGRAGAPCGCFGGRGQVPWAAVLRATLLAAAGVLLALGFAAAHGRPCGLCWARSA